MVGRETGWVSFTVCSDTKKETLQAVITEGTAKEATVFTDENRSYLWLESEEESRERKAVDHSEAWAEDRDGDDIRKDQLSGYVAMFEIAFNHDQVGPEVLQCMCGV